MILLVDPSGVFDHRRVVVEGNRLPIEASKPLAVGFDSLVYRFHFGAELVDVEGEGFTDDGGNGLVGGCRGDHSLRTGRRR